MYLHFNVCNINIILSIIRSQFFMKKKRNLNFPSISESRFSSISRNFFSIFNLLNKI